MSVVSASNLHRAYGAHAVLRGADVTLRDGERVGVVGRNGAGKSTLARILAGVEAPDEGHIARRRGATVLYLDQVPSFEAEVTAEEAVASGLSQWKRAVERYEAASRRLESGDADPAVLDEQHASAEEVERLGGFEQSHRVASMLGHLGITRTDAAVRELSGGEQRRVALARLLIARPDLAILDEPTNHLDAGTVEWLEEYLLSEYTGALLLITHDRYLLDRVAERTLEVSDGSVFSYDGGYELYLEQKAERLAHAARTEQNRQNFLRRELEWLRRQPKARGTKQKARVERAEAALAKRAPKDDPRIELELDVARTGKTILETKGLRVEQSGRVLVQDLTLFVTQGSRIGIVGPNGCGKTTLLETLLGARSPDGGTVALGQNTKVAYFDQLRSGLDDSKSVFDNVASDQSRIEIGGVPVEPRAFLERFGFDSAAQRQPVGSLSGGERARVALAKMMRKSANLLVLDEPTNDLDVQTLGALESLLVELGATALVVTHDRYFLDRVATHILAFEGDGRVVPYAGNYDAYRRLSAEARAAREPEAPPAPSTREAPRPREKKPGLTYAEARELERILDDIEVADGLVGALNARLAAPETYEDGGKDVPRLLAELEVAKKNAERLTARWEELEAKRSGT